MRLAAAPISWGVSEVPNWGVQLGPKRVLRDMMALGLSATEAGPPGFLPADPATTKRLLGEHRLRLVGGFATAILHVPERRSEELVSLDRQAAWLAAGEAEVLVLAAATGRSDYARTTEVHDDAWRALFEGLDQVAAIAERHGLTLAVHPHFGTVIERRHHVERFLARCGHALCLDTGHLALGSADPVEIAASAGARVRHVHLKDIDETLAERTRSGALDYAAAVRLGLYRPLGEGSARIRDVLRVLRANGYAGWYVLEQDVALEREPTDGPPAWIARSVSFLRSHA